MKGSIGSGGKNAGAGEFLIGNHSAQDKIPTGGLGTIKETSTRHRYAKNYESVGRQHFLAPIGQGSRP